MPSSLSGSFTAPNSPTATSFVRRRSSIFSTITGIGSHSGSSSTGQSTGHSRRGSKFSIVSCFSESSNPDKNEPRTSSIDSSPPVSPLASEFDKSTIASRRRSYVPKRAAESFSISTTPIYHREAGSFSASSLASKRMSYATQYGFKAPKSPTMETVPDN